MASHSYSTLGFGLVQEIGSNEIIKSRAYLVNPGGRKPEIKPENSCSLKLHHSEPWKPFCSLRKSNHFVEFDSAMMKHRFLDVHGMCLSSDEVDLDTESLEKTRVKPSSKKQNQKIRDGENDHYRRYTLHPCEILLSLMFSNEEHRQITMRSLRKSGGDLSEFLTQLSVSFAGTGLAVFLSVACCFASRRLLFWADKVFDSGQGLFDSGLGLSLVLLSWAVTRLKKAIVLVSRRKGIKYAESANRVERRIKDVYFGAAMVFVMIVRRIDWMLR
ncbi:unnamed protein product [Microthlaspi erraticum]|uniref:Uncharacterized protein n=1 Tax=Microthlaspi erraticum TaxID=1685480 RepID=A0A6D2JHM4_9BRAS|nr:unnamed protein product [Microthlaspi erraticum]